VRNLQTKKSKLAFTRRDLVVAVASFGLLASITYLGFASHKRNVIRDTCENNLKNITAAFRLWSGDCGDRYQMFVSTNHGGSAEYVIGGNAFRHFQCLSNELVEPRFLTCPADNRKPAANFSVLDNTNVSYFVGVDAEDSEPDMLLAGDRNLEIAGIPVSSGLLVLTNQPVWIRRPRHPRGNVTLTDGSVQEFIRLPLAAGTNVQRLAIP